jgi:hypothetical protein
MGDQGVTGPSGPSGVTGPQGAQGTGGTALIMGQYTFSFDTNTVIGFSLSYDFTGFGSIDGPSAHALRVGDRVRLIKETDASQYLYGIITTYDNTHIVVQLTGGTPITLTSGNLEVVPDTSNGGKTRTIVEFSNGTINSLGLRYVCIGSWFGQSFSGQTLRFKSYANQGEISSRGSNTQVSETVVTMGLGTAAYSDAAGSSIYFDAAGFSYDALGQSARYYGSPNGGFGPQNYELIQKQVYSDYYEIEIWGWFYNVNGFQVEFTYPDNTFFMHRLVNQASNLYPSGTYGQWVVAMQRGGLGEATAWGAWYDSTPNSFTHPYNTFYAFNMSSVALNVPNFYDLGVATYYFAQTQSTATYVVTIGGNQATDIFGKQTIPPNLAGTTNSGKGTSAFAIQNIAKPLANNDAGLGTAYATGCFHNFAVFSHDRPRTGAIGLVSTGIQP